MSRSSTFAVCGLAVVALGCRSSAPPIDPSRVAGQVFADQLRQARAQLEAEEWLAARTRLTDVHDAVPASDPVGAEARALLARVAFELGEYPEADRVASEVVGDPAWSDDARETRGLALMFACRFPDAEAELFELVKADEARGRVWLGMLFAWTGADGNAARELETVLARAPSSEHAQNARFYRAQLAYWEGRDDAARAELAGLEGYLAELARRAQNWVARATHLLRAYFTLDTLSRHAAANGADPAGFDRGADEALAALGRAPGPCAPQLARLVEARQRFVAARREAEAARLAMADAERREHERRTRDSDGDSIPDVGDRCVTEAETFNGVDDGDGCPEATAAVELSGNQIVLRRGHEVHFATGSADVLTESQPVLDAVSRILLDPGYAYIRLVRIEGHTDDIGEPDANLELSRRRAQSVGMALVARGVEQSRLTLGFHGSARPIDLSGTEEARARNRRVEFHVVDPPVIGGARRRSE